MSFSLKNLAELQTSSERAVEALFRTLARPADEAELEKMIRKRRNAGVSSNFGAQDPIFLGIGADLDRMIGLARTELGLPTPSLADHLARLQGNGPWLADLDIPPSTEWEVLEVDPGKFGCVSHQYQLLSRGNFPSAENAMKYPLRKDEGALRIFRRAYLDRFPDGPVPEAASGPSIG